MTHRCVYVLALAAAASLAAPCGAQDIELAPPLVLEHLGLSLRFPAAGAFEACQGKPFWLDSTTSRARVPRPTSG